LQSLNRVAAFCSKPLDFLSLTLFKKTMEPFYNIIAILTAGISLTIGIVSLLTFRQKSGKKIDLVFGILCLLVVVFLLLPPVGFIVSDHATYPGSIGVKKIFNLAFLGLFPWFIAFYTGNKNTRMPFTLTVSTIICYLLMFISSGDNSDKLWVLIVVMILAANIAYGSYAAIHQFSTGQKKEATRLVVAVSCFSFLNLLGIIYQPGNNDYNAYWDAIFLPMNLCPLAFLLMIGVQRYKASNEPTPLETITGLRGSRWQSILEHMQFIIVNTDTTGRIRYINTYGASFLGYNDPSELINADWSKHCLIAKDTGSKTGFMQVVPTDDAMITNKNIVITRDGKEKIINWNSDLIYSDDGNLVGRMSIGSDVTMHEEAVNQIKELKAQLEKEALVPQRVSTLSVMNKEVIGRSAPFMYAIEKSKQVAPTNASVLLLGETGVGKEAFADLIQETSLRSKMPFVKVNCGALPAELIEDELFGHEKGAFTGAIQSRIGRFEKANGGTIFLDEIGELPLVLQPKLLRVLQNGEFERVGGHQTIKVDVRVIAATNNDLEKEMRENRFRDDLFYRLNVFPITIPPLRKRAEDIILLIQHFIDGKSKEHGKRFENISKADMNRLCDYEWPGNIRELKNVIERAVISSEAQTLKLDWFYEDIEAGNQSTSPASLEEMETAHILKVLQECRWKINGENGAAEKLVMHPNTLRSRMKKLKINVPWRKSQPVS
jgi:PAS domain S-box-containing protein